MITDVVERLKEMKEPFLITHIDADGLTSAAIIYQALEKLGKKPEFHAVKKLDESEVKPYRNKELVFTDLGSGISEIIPTSSVVIDHHQPDEKNDEFYHLNAHLMGWNGSREISASGLAYLVAEEMGFDELLPLAIVGAVGDLQDRRGLKGKNKQIADYGVEKGFIERKKGLGFFGRETRPLHVFLEYGSDPYIPGLSGRKEACVELLRKCGILLGEGKLRAYHDLSKDEKKRLITAVHLKAIQAGLYTWEIDNLIKDYYIIPSSPRHTELRDVMEFSTLLNATGRHKRPEVGLGVCTEPSKYYEEAKLLLKKHRRIIREGIDELMEEGTEEFGDNLKVFKSERIKPTIIGIIIGMGVGSRVVRNKILVGAVPADEKIKLSFRMPSFLLREGVNLGLAAREAAQEVSGIGGGHDIAAGAQIPKTELNKFLKHFDGLIHSQLNPEPPETKNQ